MSKKPINAYMIEKNGAIWGEKIFRSRRKAQAWIDEPMEKFGGVKPSWMPKHIWDQKVKNNSVMRVVRVKIKKME